MFGLEAKLAALINRDPPQVPNEQELVAELRAKLGPGADPGKLLFQIRSARGKTHWAVNSYLREVMTSSAPGREDFQPSRPARAVAAGLALPVPPAPPPLSYASAGETNDGNCDDDGSCGGSGCVAAAVSTVNALPPLVDQPTCSNSRPLQSPSGSLCCSKEGLSQQPSSLSDAAPPHDFVSVLTLTSVPGAAGGDGNSGGSGGGSSSCYVGGSGGPSLDSLPVSLLEAVFRYLDYRSLCAAAMASKMMSMASTSESLWSSLYFSRWGKLVFPTEPHLGPSGLGLGASGEGLGLGLALGPPGVAGAGTGMGVGEAAISEDPTCGVAMRSVDRAPASGAAAAGGGVGSGGDWSDSGSDSGTAAVASREGKGEAAVLGLLPPLRLQLLSRPRCQRQQRQQQQQQQQSQLQTLGASDPCPADLDLGGTDTSNPLRLGSGALERTNGSCSGASANRPSGSVVQPQSAGLEECLGKDLVAAAVQGPGPSQHDPSPQPHSQQQQEQEQEQQQQNYPSPWPLPPPTLPTATTTVTNGPLSAVLAVRPCNGSPARYNSEVCKPFAARLNVNLAMEGRGMVEPAGGWGTVGVSSGGGGCGGSSLGKDGGVSTAPSSSPASPTRGVAIGEKSVAAGIMAAEAVGRCVNGVVAFAAIPSPGGPNAGGNAYRHLYRRQMAFINTLRCPRCGGGSIVPIVYGFPSPKLMEGMRERRLILGGDHLIENCHVWGCNRCGASFRHFPYDRCDNWVSEMARPQPQRPSHLPHYTYEL